jgi:hypothetical protein
MYKYRGKIQQQRYKSYEYGIEHFLFGSCSQYMCFTAGIIKGRIQIIFSTLAATFLLHVTCPCIAFTSVHLLFNIFPKMIENHCTTVET